MINLFLAAREFLIKVVARDAPTSLPPVPTHPQSSASEKCVLVAKLKRNNKKKLWTDDSAMRGCAKLHIILSNLLALKHNEF